MDKTVFLHIGCHKVGSTAMQHHLAFYNPLLKLFSFSFPRLHGGFFSTRNQDIAFDVMPRMDSSGDSLQKYAEYIKNSRYKKYFLSAESLYNKRGAAEYLSELNNIARVKIIFFVRRQDTFIESIYKQLIKNDPPSLDTPFAPYLRRSTHDWGKIISGWEPFFPAEDIVIIPAREYAPFDSIKAIADVIGLPIVAKLPRLPVRNRSLSCETIDFIRWLRRNGIEYNKRRLDAFDQRLPERTYAYMTLDQRLQLLKRLGKRNKDFADRFGISTSFFTDIDREKESNKKVYNQDDFDPTAYFDVARQVKLIENNILAGKGRSFHST